MQDAKPRFNDNRHYPHLIDWLEDFILKQEVHVCCAPKAHYHSMIEIQERLVQRKLLE